MKSFNAYIKTRLVEGDELPNAGYELQGVPNTDVNRTRFENAKKQYETISAFLTDLDGKYALVKNLIPQETIEKIKKTLGFSSTVISRFQAAAYAPNPK
jgi:hypothetical protein